MEMVIPIALGVVLGLIIFRWLANIFEPLIEWWGDQHWVGKVILLAVIIVLVWVAIENG